MSKEEFEIEKIKLEIAQLKEPFWKKANVMISVMTVLITALIGFNSYFVKVDQANITKIEQLEKENKENEALRQKIQVENLNLQKTQIEIKAEENKNKAEQYSIRLAQVEKEFNLKNNVLKNLNERLGDSTKKLNKIQTDYAKYKEKVKKITEYMAGYGPGYARGVLSTKSGKDEIKKIAQLPNASDRASEIDTFVMNIVNQTFNKYTTKKNGELDLLE